MASIEHKELFEQYYQKEYDFNTASLSQDEVEEIKILVREKRVDYNLAPMGTDVFGWILKQNSNIRFEMVAFDSEKIDGMLYVPASGKERAYIILNSNKPLINQIFSAAHEYYHYIKDYQKFKNTPYICDFNMLKDVNEKCASRFAAELLLPEEALYREIKAYQKQMDVRNVKEMDFSHFAALVIILTVKYQMPLKAVIYRLAEENYIDNVEKYIGSYEFIKKLLREIHIVSKQVEELYSKENVYVIPYGATYQDMEKAYSTGNASRENILEDAQKLNLDLQLINDFLSQEEVDDDDDDEELFEMINKKRR